MNSKNKLVNSQIIEGIFIGQFKTTESGILSYYVESDGQSCLIDPIYDVSSYLELIQQRKSKLSFVCLTHYHEDYISGHSQLLVTLMMGPLSTRPKSNLKVVQNKDGQQIRLGGASIKILHTPGHTLQSTCFVVSSSSKKDIAVFTGDTLFVGFTGRTNLDDIEGYTPIGLSEILFDSVQRLKQLQKSIIVYPGHCLGAFTGRSLSLKLSSTIQQQLAQNTMLAFTQKTDFVTENFKYLQPAPKFFSKVRKINEQGAPNLQQTYNKTYRSLKLQDFIHLRETKLIDTRIQIGQGLLHGSYWFPGNGPINFWIHNFLHPEEKFIIISKEGQSQDIVKRLLRIGYFNLEGVVEFDLNLLGQKRITPQILKFKTYHEYQDKSHIDVRSPDEYRSDGVIEGTIRIPLNTFISTGVKDLRHKKNEKYRCKLWIWKTGSSFIQRFGAAKYYQQSFGRRYSNVKIDLDKFNDNGLSVVPFKEQ